ncbi:hypothetical protein CMUS01_04062 [Colletotrichum musicola]|uniref:C2H2-type domain-containing protein n=1 Tax=Colletotrichum musicola TaxID=2175873 RepID=A0A8H6U1J3_9PEZI|nr:hypothetical protein CMUS01_04062 [Colletotrichum musicola]
MRRHDGGKAAEERMLTALMSQHISESVISGAFFVDASGKGSRLHRWKDAMMEAIRATRIDPGLSSPIGQHLDDMDSVITDEDTQLLGTLIWIWKSMGGIDDDVEISRAIVRQSKNSSRQDIDPCVRKTFINHVLRRCVTLLGKRHVVTNIFACLKHGSFDPSACLERLDLLPSEMFGASVANVLPSFERDETSDYQTVGSFADNQSWTSEPELHGLSLGSEVVAFKSLHGSSAPTWREGSPESQDVYHRSYVKNESQVALKAGQSDCDDSMPETSDVDSPMSSIYSTDLTVALVDSWPHVKTLDEEKKAIVDRVMQAFLRDFDVHLSEFADVPHDGDSGTTTTSCAGSRYGSSGASSKRSGCSNKKRTRQDGSDNSEGNNDGIDETPSKKQLKEGDLVPMRLACQYFKWNPRKYNQRPCSGPGWKSVHHVKDHLYRHHRAPKYRCARCQQVFVSNAEVGEHARTQPPCEVRHPVPTEEFGQEQEDRIRARLSRRAGERRTERERWSDDFQILFDVRDDEVPTPWYDYDLTILSRQETFNEYLRREIMPVMRREIDQQVERYMADVEPQILSRVRDIIRRVRPPMWESYQRNMAQGVVMGEVGDDIPSVDGTVASSGDDAVNPERSSSGGSMPSASQAQATWSANVSLQPFSGNNFGSTLFPEFHNSQTSTMQQGLLGPNFSVHVEDWEFLGDPSSEGLGYNFDTI